MPEIRNFVIVNPDNTEQGSYTGRTPRQAATKAIKAVCEKVNDPTTIRLRARGEKRIHVFRGHISMEKAPMDRPTWIPEFVKVAHVAKVGIEKVDKIGSELVKAGVLTNEVVAKINTLPLPGQKVN